MNAIFNIIAIPFGYVMQFCYWLTQGNYLIALLLFSCIIEIVLLPFAIKQQKNSIKAAKLRPKEMAIRKKYAGRNDQPTQQKMMQEIQEMQQKEGYSPFGGCLQILIQMPLIIALYNIVYDPFKYILNFSTETIEAIKNVITDSGVVLGNDITTTRTIGLLTHIKNLGVEAFSGVEGFTEKVQTIEDLPNLTVLGLNLAETPGFEASKLILLVIPALTFLTYFLSMKLTRKFTYQPQPAADNQQMACSNAMMDYMMPLMSTFFTFAVPAAIGIYWIFRSILSTGKQFLMAKVMPLPAFTEEDYKAAELEFKGKSPVTRTLDPNRPKVRSLHHIDDDDYEVTVKKNDRKNLFSEGVVEKYDDEDSEKVIAPEEKEVGGMKIEQAPKKKDDRK